MGDVNNRGGAIVMPNNFNVFANFKLVAAGPSIVAPHFKCPGDLRHCAALTLPFNIGKVFVNGMPVVAELDFDTCGDSRVIGSLNVYVG
jgi:hypothetical protein